MALKYINKSENQDMNTSIVSDLSVLESDDFDMIIEHLLCKPKSKPKPKPKPKNAKKSIYRKVHAAQSVPALNAIELFNVPVEHDESPVNATFSAANTSYLSALNDTCTTINSEQFENIFAYFEQDVTTDDLLLSDESDIDERPIDTPPNERENVTSDFQNLLLSDQPESNKKQSPEPIDIQNNSKAILNKIQLFNGFEPRKNIGKKPSQRQQQQQRMQHRPVSVLSTSSTASLHDSDSDTNTFKKPFDIVRHGTVRNKVAFFSDHSSTERSSSASPSIQSVSDDDDYRFQRTQSKHRFQKNRSFFEDFFKEKQNDESSIDTSTFRIENNQSIIKKDIDNSENEKINKTRKSDQIVSNQIDPQEKLKAVQTYVQTQYLLERIQRLVTAISNLDEKRLGSMNLKLLKKFLSFIRDCSYNCTEVCNAISQNVLTDFEKNIMSAEDLLYSALKGAHSAQVHKAKQKQNKNEKFTHKYISTVSFCEV